MGEERKKKEREEEGPVGDPNAWMLTFSDLVNLMLTFFVLLISMSSLDAQRLKQSFGDFAGVSGVLFKADRRSIETIHDLRIKPIIPRSLVDGIMRIVSEKFKEDKEVNNEDLAQIFKNNEYNDLIKVEFKDNRLEINLSNKIVFEKGKADLIPIIKDVLKKVAVVLAEDAFRIRVESRASDSPADHNKFRSIWHLALRRATNIVSYLSEEGGINPARLSVAGYSTSDKVKKQDKTQKIESKEEKSKEEKFNKNRSINIILTKQTIMQ